MASSGLPLVRRSREQIQWWLEARRLATCIGRAWSLRRVTAERAYESQTVYEHTWRAGSSVGHADDPGEVLGREEIRQLGRGVDLDDLPFAISSVQVAADLQRVAEDEAAPLHPGPGEVRIQWWLEQGGWLLEGRGIRPLSEAARLTPFSVEVQF